MASGEQRRQSGGTSGQKPLITSQTDDGTNEIDRSRWARPLLAVQQPTTDTGDGPLNPIDPVVPPLNGGNVQGGITAAPTTYTPETPMMDTHAQDRSRMPWYSMLMQGQGRQRV